jgi:hypothetical protein
MNDIKDCAEFYVWKPFDTAPKDGRLIVIRMKKSAFPFVAYWSPVFKAWAAPSFEKEEIIQDGEFTRLRFVAIMPETGMGGWAPIPQITSRMPLDD